MRKFLKSGVFLGNFRINNEKCQISEIWLLRISAKNEFRDFDFRPIGLRTLGLWEVDSSYSGASRATALGCLADNIRHQIFKCF